MKWSLSASVSLPGVRGLRWPPTRLFPPGATRRTEREMNIQRSDPVLRRFYPVNQRVHCPSFSSLLRPLQGAVCRGCASRRADVRSAQSAGSALSLCGGASSLTAAGGGGRHTS
ncbi:unnamed protein product [Pleuronectes platessa]|uniref:Uncharacterized protein n=1 Tax=Pleuronectes platessa TaxID=8262 RepID=A0A9N7THQ9_PLEPL|nr:unnamed protein product [Pleuronectes platessa]